MVDFFQTKEIESHKETAAHRCFFGGGKPLSTAPAKGASFPTLFVDMSSRPGRPPTPPAVPVTDEAASAAAAWGGRDGEGGVRWPASWLLPTGALDPWPAAATGLLCWHCAHLFSWGPFPLPVSRIRPRDPKDPVQWRVRGAFCGPSCCKAYATERDLPQKGNVMCWIDELAWDRYGYDRKARATPAPPRELLAAFCGPGGFSIEQFRNAGKYGRRLRILRPGFITIKQVVEAEQRSAAIYSGVIHKESYAQSSAARTADVVKKREVFPGKNVRRLADVISRKPK